MGMGINNVSIRIRQPLNEEPQVSMYSSFCSTMPHRTISLKKWLLTAKFKDIVEEYRNSTDEWERQKIKRNVPCITPSGVFGERNSRDVRSYSNMLCLDIDGKHNEPLCDWEIIKKIIGRHCPSLYYAGLSIGGDGIFLIFRIMYPNHYEEQFSALASEFYKAFGLYIDHACRSVASARCASYDPNPYYNPHAIPYANIMSLARGARRIIRNSREAAQIKGNVEFAIKHMQINNVDITDYYNDWFKIGCSLASEFGEDGRHMFHQVSRMCKSKYHEGDCDIQFNKCLKYDKKVTIATFFHYCKEHRVKFRPH